jgi:hypothetical protein
MIHTLPPIYLVTVLGTATLTVGFIEGIAEATANISKISSGVPSDWPGNRKLLTGPWLWTGSVCQTRLPAGCEVGCLQLGSLIGSGKACATPSGMRSLHEGANYG